MTIPLESVAYPFLAISQHREVDYGQVLDYADFVRWCEFAYQGNMRAVRKDGGAEYDEIPVPIMAEIRRAVHTQEAIRKGILGMQGQLL